MTELHWLNIEDGPASLPDPDRALSEPNGLLAAGGSLAPEWLLASYRKGIFPWFEEGQQILWWSPDPRTVLEPNSLKVSRSLRKRIRRSEFTVTADTAFAAVISACSKPRRYTDATWITPQMQSAYIRLHETGWAHSFEAWKEDELVGGLYGIGIGQVFFGESMFAATTDASKVAFWHAVRFLMNEGCELIDCQLSSEHLSSLGAIPVPRQEFLNQLQRLIADPGTPGSWSTRFASCSANCDD